MSDLSFADYRADEALDKALSGVRSRSSVLKAICRKAGDMLAETDGHAAAAALHAGRAHFHHTNDARRGRSSSRGQR